MENQLLKSGQPTDRYGRRIDYLRISVTDRCNLRCRYCMPDGVNALSHADILRFDEIERIVRAGAACGIRHVRLTGGEPLVRRDLPVLVSMLRETGQLRSIMLTTNGVLLKEQLPALLSAGLDGVNISLDTLNPEAYRRITGFDKLPAVLDAIEAALSAGLPTKINVTVQKDVNTGAEAVRLAALAKDRPLLVRFIEMMPIGCGKDFLSVDNRSLLAELNASYPGMRRMEPVSRGEAAGQYSMNFREQEMHGEQGKEILGNGPAVYYEIPGFAGKIGFISAMSERFCETCNRMRLTSTGYLKYCLCYGDGIDLRALLRTGAGEEDIRAAFAEALSAKPAAHCFADRSHISEEHRMHEIGG